MKTTSLGLIEVKGYVGAIEAVDAALKAANVTLLNMEKISGGLVTVKLIGDVAAVQAAVEAGGEAAKKVTLLISSHVIPRVHEETMNVLKCSTFKRANEIEQSERKEAELEVKDVEVAIPAEQDEAEQKKSPRSNPVSNDFIAEQELESLTVGELRKLARSFHLKDVSPKDIKYGRKDFLIEKILDHYREEESE